MAKINVLGSVLTGSEYAKIKARAEEIGATSVDVRCDDETGELKVWYHKKHRNSNESVGSQGILSARWTDSTMQSERKNTIG